MSKERRSQKGLKMPRAIDYAKDEALVAAAKETAIKKRKPRKDQMNYGAENTKPGDNAYYLRHALVSYDLPPIDISDPKQVEQRVKDYFGWCLENDQKPKVMGMANWLGISRDTLNSWKRGEWRSGAHTEIMRKAFGLMEELWEGYMQDNKINTVSGIFLGKVMFGYREPTEIVITPGQPIAEAQDPDQIAERYALLEDTDPSRR